MNESKEESTQKLKREKEQVGLRKQIWRKKRQMQVTCNFLPKDQEADIARGVLWTSIASQPKITMTSISLVSESVDGLESDSLKEVQREPIQCDDLVMDGAAKQDLSCLNSEQEDM